jgi:predicted acetyltransferase
VPTTELRLRPPRAEDEAPVRAAQELLAADDFEFALGLSPEAAWPDYLRTLASLHAGIDVPADRVPASFLLADVGGVLVGRTSIRHELNDWLLAHGGHIGYGVLPDHRRRGYAREILRQSLIIARAHGVDRALLTCDDDNVGSIATIEGAGGRLDEAWPRVDGPPARRRYWID